jgi:hypothetical protein
VGGSGQKCYRTRFALSTTALRCNANEKGRPLRRPAPRFSRDAQLQLRDHQLKSNMSVADRGHRQRLEIQFRSMNLTMVA